MPQWRERRLEEYALAEDDKAMAINVRGWFAMATRMLDETSARRRALEECNALVEREVPIVRDFDRCVIWRRRQQGGVAVPGAAYAARTSTCPRPGRRRPFRSMPPPCP